MKDITDRDALDTIHCYRAAINKGDYVAADSANQALIERAIVKYYLEVVTNLYPQNKQNRLNELRRLFGRSLELSKNVQLNSGEVA